LLNLGYINVAAPLVQFNVVERVSGGGFKLSHAGHNFYLKALVKHRNSRK
jgi:hypothetical protein